MAALSGTALGLAFLALELPRAIARLQHAAGLSHTLAVPSLGLRELAFALVLATVVGALTGAFATPRISAEGERA